MTSLKALFDIASKGAADIFAARGELAPMWHFVTESGDHFVMVTPWGDPQEKALTVGLLREFIAAKNVRRYVMVVEAWTVLATTKARTDDALSYVGRMNEHPDRRETLMIHAEDRDGTQLVGNYYILRPEHRDTPVLSPLHMLERTESVGVLSGMFSGAA